VSLVLETLRSDESLDLGSFGVWLLAFTFRLNLSSNDELADIIFLVETKESSDFGSTLRTESLWLNDISQTWDVAFALLDNREGEDR